VTLIELLIVIAVVSILTSLAVGSYRRYGIRANRSDATTTILRIQVAQEKFFLQNNGYAANMATVVAAPPAGLGVALGAGNTTPGGYYTVSIASASATQYSVTATATGPQAADIAACQTFNINEQGTRTPVSSSGCWR
jgi:type IV pilus assembly protein PilE